MNVVLVLLVTLRLVLNADIPIHQIYDESVDNSTFPSTVDLRTLTSNSYNCIIRVIEFENSHRVNYSPIVDSPLVIQIISRSSKHLYISPKLLTTKPSAGLRLKNLSCMSNIIFLPVVEFSTGPEWERNVRTSLADIIRERQLNITGLFLTLAETWMFISPSLSVVHRDFVDRAVTTASGRGTTPMFWVPLVEKQTPHSAWLFCWYCSETTTIKGIRVEVSTLQTLSLRDLMATYKKVVGLDGRNMKWASNLDPSALITTKCPTTLKRFPTCLVSHSTLAIIFLKEWQNITSSHSFKNMCESIQCSWSAQPLICFKNLNVHQPMYAPVTQFLSTMKLRLRFITSDEILETFEHWISPLINPFEPSVWILFVASALVIAVILTQLLNGTFKNFIFNIISIASVFLDQYSPPKGSIMTRRNIYARATTNIVVFVWILVIMVIGNCYKSIVKSNYFVEPMYNTKWKALIELENFTAYVASELLPTNIARLERNPMATCRWNFEESNENCEDEKLYRACALARGDGVNFCLMAHVYMRWQDNGGISSVCQWRSCSDEYRWWLNKYDEIGKSILIRARRLQSTKEGLKTAISELKKARTIYLTSTEHIGSHYRVLKWAGKRYGVKFAHNDQEDHLFGIAGGYEISGIFPTFHRRNIVLARAQVLIQSGILEWWRKWEKFRYDYHHRTEDDEEQVVALGFGNSDILIVFCLYLYCVAITISVLVMEMMFTLCKNRKTALACCAKVSTWIDQGYHSP